MELQDWELLQNPESGMSLPSNSSEASRNFEGIGEEEGEDSVITSDYFALDSEKRYAKKVAEVEEGSVDSENPSWVDPSLGFQRSEFWSDSGSDGFGSQKFRVSEGRDEVGSPKIEDELQREVGFDGVEESRGFQGERVDFGRKGTHLLQGSCHDQQLKSLRRNQDSAIWEFKTVFSSLDRKAEIG